MCVPYCAFTRTERKPSVSSPGCIIDADKYENMCMEIRCLCPIWYPVQDRRLRIARDVHLKEPLDLALSHLSGNKRKIAQTIAGDGLFISNANQLLPVAVLKWTEIIPRRWWPGSADFTDGSLTEAPLVGFLGYSALDVTQGVREPCILAQNPRRSSTPWWRWSTCRTACAANWKEHEEEIKALTCP